jgi:hypothetical protein
VITVFKVAIEYGLCRSVRTRRPRGRTRSGGAAMRNLRWAEWEEDRDRAQRAFGRNVIHLHAPVRRTRQAQASVSAHREWLS